MTNKPKGKKQEGLEAIPATVQRLVVSVHSREKTREVHGNRQD